jgi:hypothetical protein
MVVMCPVGRPVSQCSNQSCRGPDGDMRGTCYGGGSGTACLCYSGYSGPNCEFSRDDGCAALSHCHGHGDCTYNFDGRGNCRCDYGYESEFKCSELEPHQNVCDANPGICKNGGWCDAVAPMEYECECPPGKMRMQVALLK